MNADNKLYNVRYEEYKMENKIYKFKKYGSYINLVLWMLIFSSYVMLIWLYSVGLSTEGFIIQVIGILLFFGWPTFFLVVGANKAFVTTIINSKGVMQKGLTKTIVTLNWDEIKEIGLTANPNLGHRNICFYFSKNVLNDQEQLCMFNKNSNDIIIQRYNKNIYAAIRYFYKGEIKREEYIPLINKLIIK